MSEPSRGSEVTELKYWWSGQTAVFTAEVGHNGKERGELSKDLERG